MGPRNQEEKSSSEDLEAWELTGAIYFTPTVERILYGAHTARNASPERLSDLVLSGVLALETCWRSSSRAPICSPENPREGRLGIGIPGSSRAWYAAEMRLRVGPSEQAVGKPGGRRKRKVKARKSSE